MSDYLSFELTTVKMAIFSCPPQRKNSSFIYVDMYVQDLTALMFLQEFYIYLYHAFKVLLLFRLFRNQDLSENSSVYFLMGVDKSGMCFMGLLVIDFFDRY